ncbi:VanZ family protein [Arthrobacter sp. N199823]|uniref:VanZ family protein n=1 Tax=Arthrobacter sp. N199823 TaxID=2058895 RepID=UPI0015E27D7B|nr:VanZ family protein [Arthrobacter sp. N199823]
MNKPLHRIIVALAAAYLLAVVLIVFWPTPVDRPAAGTLHEVLSWLHRHGMPKFINYNVVEFSANILLFIPFGIILTLRLHRRLWWLSVVIAAATSGAVELAQSIFLPERVPAWSDVVANTSGAFIGTMLVLVIWALRRRKTLRSTPAMR